METFSALLALCEGNQGNPPVTGGFPSQRPVTWSFDVFFDLRLNKQLSKQSKRWSIVTPSHPLWRQCNVKWISDGSCIHDIAQHPRFRVREAFSTTPASSYVPACNTLMPGQMAAIMQTTFFKCIVLNENVGIWHYNFTEVCSWGFQGSKTSLVPVMAWHRTDSKPLHKPIMAKQAMHVCVIRPQQIDVTGSKKSQNDMGVSDIIPRLYTFIICGTHESRRWLKYRPLCCWQSWCWQPSQPYQRHCAFPVSGNERIASISWWRHEMEKSFRVTGHLCGEFTVTGEFPEQRPMTQSLVFFSLIYAWINGWVNNREAGDLRHHRTHYDVIGISFTFFTSAAQQKFCFDLCCCICLIIC